MSDDKWLGTKEPPELAALLDAIRGTLGPCLMALVEAEREKARAEVAARVKAALDEVEGFCLHWTFAYEASEQASKHPQEGCELCDFALAALNTVRAALKDPS